MFFKKMACSFGLLVLAFCYNCGAMAQGQGGEIEPINSGFVFVDGKYLEAPYRAEVRDLVVLINGIQITQPPYIRPNLIVTEDPGVPAGLTKEVGLDDFRKIKWEERIPFDAAKLAYIVGKYSKEEVQEKMLAYYRSLPCIKKAECVGGYGIRLTDYRRRSFIVGLDICPEDLKPPPTEEELQKQVEKLVDIYKERFRKGDCYFFFKKGIKLSMAERKAVNLLREMRDVLLDNTKDNQTKANELLSLGLIPALEADLAEMVISNFQQNDQFDKRLEALQSKIVTEYGPDALHPAERVGDLFLKERQQKEEYLQKKSR